MRIVAAIAMLAAALLFASLGYGVAAALTGVSSALFFVAALRGGH